MAFFGHDSSTGIFISTDEAIHAKNTFLVEGAAILIPGMSATASLQHKDGVHKRVNRKDDEKTYSLARYVVSFQGRVHRTLKNAIVSIPFICSYTKCCNSLLFTNSFIVSGDRICNISGFHT